MDNESTETPAYWSTWSPNSAYDASNYAQRGGFSGNYAGVHWNNGSSSYEVATYQTVTGLPDGIYTVKARVKANGTHAGRHLYVKNYGGTEKNGSHSRQPELE